MSYTLLSGTVQNRAIWGVNSNADIYGQLLAAEIVEFLGGSFALGLVNLAKVNLDMAIAAIAAGIGYVAPGTEAAAMAFLTNIGIERFFGFLEQAASVGISPYPDVMVFGDEAEGTPVGVFSAGAKIKIGRKTYEVRRLDPFELSGLITWTVGVPNINWIGSWYELPSISLVADATAALPSDALNIRSGNIATTPGTTAPDTSSSGGQAATPAPQVNKAFVAAGAAFLLFFILKPGAKE